MNREQVTGRPETTRPLEAKIKFATEINKLKANALKSRVEDYVNDPQRPVRLSEYECRSCYYLDETVASLSFINTTCTNCGTKIVWGDTRVPTICRECAEQHAICMRCYGQIHE